MDAVLAREGVSSSQRVAARRLRMEALNEVIIRLSPVTSAEAHRHAGEMSGYERRSLGLLTDARLPPFSAAASSEHAQTRRYRTIPIAPRGW